MRRRDLLIGSLAAPFTLAIRRTGWADATPVAADEWAHPEWFATPDWVEQNQHDPGITLIELIALDEFEKAHIPDSVQIDWPDLALTDSADATVEKWRATVERQLTDLGVTTSSTVVIYDGGTFYASRLWWILDQLGHKDKLIINGGTGAWIEADGETETGSSWRITTPDEPYVGTPNEDALARIDEVAMVSDNGWGVLVDARTPDEFRKGRIPHAVNIPFLDNAEPDSGGRWKSPADLRAMYEAKGVTPDQLVIAYCSTGVRSAATYFTLKALGYPKVKLYSASYAEWSSQLGRHIEAGATP
jgi:thiosulfate/3-mercaptopyruvate sulfurtransferase